MRVHNHHPLVTTSQEKCRACYTCVRECPARAIRISSGQAEVLVERCIGCGNCFRVCSQGAKQVYDSMDEVRQVLDEGRPVSPMLAQARVLRQIYGPSRKLVFIGPCLAKRAEQDPDNPGEINGVLTFIELQKMLDHTGITPERLKKVILIPGHLSVHCYPSPGTSSRPRTSTKT
jgi:iron only hydrogenase large subunit-like protein